MPIVGGEFLIRFFYFFILLIPSLLIKVMVLLIYTFMIEHYFEKFKFNILLIELIYLIVNYSFKTIGINENIYEITFLFNFEMSKKY